LPSPPLPADCAMRDKVKRNGEIKREKGEREREGEEERV
jgi:hypothetical protein